MRTQQLLTAVLQDKTEAGEINQPGLDPPRQEALKKQVAQLFKYELPQAYVDILSQTDGLDCNGVVLYASKLYAQGERFTIQGFVEANMLLRDYLPNRDYIYFAESGMDFYRHNMQSGKFEISPRVGGTVFESFDTDEELFNQVLNHMLGNYKEDPDEEISTPLIMRPAPTEVGAGLLHYKQRVSAKSTAHQPKPIQVEAPARFPVPEA